MLPKSRAKGAMAAENKFTELFQWTQNKELAIRKILAFHFMMSYFNYVCTPMNTDGLKGNESRIRKILYVLRTHPRYHFSGIFVMSFSFLQLGY